MEGYPQVSAGAEIGGWQSSRPARDRFPPTKRALVRQLGLGDLKRFPALRPALSTPLPQSEATRRTPSPPRAGSPRTLPPRFPEPPSRSPLASHHRSASSRSSKRLPPVSRVPLVPLAPPPLPAHEL